MIKKFLQTYEKLLPDIISGLIVEGILIFIGWLFRIIDIWISVMVIVGGTAWVGCGYIAFKHKKVQGKGRNKVKKIMQWQYPKHRTYSLFGFILIPILAIGWLGYRNYQQKLPPDKVLVLVANFDGTNPENYRVTETVLSTIKEAVVNYADVEVKPLGKTITEAEGSDIARQIGKEEKATILIWGWYGVTKEVVPLSVHVEMFLSPDAQLTYHLNPEQEMSGEIVPQKIADLESFTLQTNLSNKMAFLGLYTVGVVRYSKNDYDGAIASFKDALNQDNVILTDENKSVLYRVIGDAYNDKGGSAELAIPYYDKAIQYNPNWAVLYNNRGFAYDSLQQYEPALKDYDRAIQLDTTVDFYYAHRGTMRLLLKNYEGALNDFNKAIELNNTRVEYYANRGAAYLLLGEIEKGIADLRYALTMTDDPNLREQLLKSIEQAENAPP